ncbi:hypothetical protein SSBR45G_67930 [Bradyrhizobium sp. SSBR45G]|nr:hypothetical protein SSBR45G_67930 [Bradyrhizobium sp. SSBR45G]GLH89363.1 hypothetical protein SSBR45R_68240 [Bradyrhizobium sp. SSBR45R]
MRGHRTGSVRGEAIPLDEMEQSPRDREPISYSVMPGLVPGIHVTPKTPDDVDGRDKPGHDVVGIDERNM